MTDIRRFTEPEDRTYPAIRMWCPHYEPLTWPVLAYLKWKTAVPFKRDTTFSGQGKPAQIIRNVRRDHDNTRNPPA